MNSAASAPGAPRPPCSRVCTLTITAPRTPLRQLAGLAAPEPRLLVITPYDKGALHEIEKAIQTSDLGLTPINDGKLIRVPIPELTEERRKELVRHVHKTAEEFRVSVRNHRRDANDKLKKMHKDKKLDDDDVARRRNQGPAASPPSTSRRSTRFWRPRKPR